MTLLAIAALLLIQNPVRPLPESGVFEGRILATEGRPATAIRVFAIPVEASEIELRIAAATQTDSAGRFRLEGLTPGRYYVAAGPLGRWTMYPGVTTLAAARAVSSANSGSLDFTLDQATVDMLYELAHIPENILPVEPSGRTVSAQTTLTTGQLLLYRPYGEEEPEEWWAARVIGLLPDGSVKVHQLGSDDEDETFPRSRLQLDEQVIEKMWIAQRKRGFPEPEETEWGVVPASPGSIESTGLTVTAQTPLKTKQLVQVEEGRAWWAASVVELLGDGRVRVHYLGWGSRADEVVPRSRLQLDDKAVEKARRSPSSKLLESTAESEEKLDFPDPKAPIEAPLMTVIASIPVSDEVLLHKEPWHLRLSKDGRYLRVFSTAIVTYDVRSGAVLKTIPLLPGETVEATSSDGSRAVLSAEKHVTLLDVETGRRDLLPESWLVPSEYDVYSYSISGDGRLFGVLAIGEGEERLIVDVYDLASLKHVTRRSHGLFAGGEMSGYVSKDGLFVVFENNRTGVDLTHAGTGLNGPEFPGPLDGFWTTLSDGAWAVQVPYQGTVQESPLHVIVRDAVTGQPRGKLAVLNEDEATLTSVSICGDRAILGRKHEVTVHDLPSGKVIAHYPVNTDSHIDEDEIYAPQVLICSGKVAGFVPTNRTNLTQAAGGSELILMQIPD